MAEPRKKRNNKQNKKARDRLVDDKEGEIIPGRSTLTGVVQGNKEYHESENNLLLASNCPNWKKRDGVLMN